MLGHDIHGPQENIGRDFCKAFDPQREVTRHDAEPQGKRLFPANDFHGALKCSYVNTGHSIPPPTPFSYACGDVSTPRCHKSHRLKAV